MAESKKPIGLQVRDEKIAEVELPEIDCDMMDAPTRRVMIYLINQELKRYKSYPKAWVGGAVAELEGIKAGLEMCKRIRKKKQNAEQKTSSEGTSEQST